MPAETETINPDFTEQTLPLDSIDEDIDPNDPYVVILYNDDYHSPEQVSSQLQKATGYEFDRCHRIMLEAHTRGRAIAYTGSASACERVASILRQIRLQVETDKF